MFTREEFLSQGRIAGEEIVEQYGYVLDQFQEGLLFYYFGNLDQVSHLMWRAMDPEHPAYGDNHPRFGAPGTRNDVPELAEFLRVLLNAGYLSKDVRRVISFEVKPMPGETAEFIIEDSKRALLEAWEQI